MTVCVNYLVTNKDDYIKMGQIFSFCYFYNIRLYRKDYYDKKYIFLLEICKI